MKGINKVFLIGFLGHPPEVQQSSGGATYARLSVATHRPKKTDEGKWEMQTEWHRVTVWGRKAELCASFLQTGSPVAVEGHLSHYRTEPEGQVPQYHTTIVADEVHFLPAPRGSAGRTPEAAS